MTPWSSNRHAFVLGTFVVMVIASFRDPDREVP
jgi:hypothetical protein